MENLSRTKQPTHTHHQNQRIAKNEVVSASFVFSARTSFCSLSLFLKIILLCSSVFLCFALFASCRRAGAVHVMRPTKSFWRKSRHCLRARRKRACRRPIGASLRVHSIFRHRWCPPHRSRLPKLHDNHRQKIRHNLPGRLTCSCATW